MHDCMYDELRDILRYLSEQKWKLRLVKRNVTVYSLSNLSWFIHHKS